MFIHIFKTRLKCLLRNKTNLLWVMCFPLILATIFAIAASGQIRQISEGIPAIEVAVTPHDNIVLEQMLHELEQGDEPLLSITYVSAEESTKLLANNTVTGVITATEENVLLKVKAEGIEQTILTNVLDNFTQTNVAIHALTEDNPAILQDDLLQKTRNSYIDKAGLLSFEEFNPSVYNYHTLLAMACFFGGYFGIRCIAETQINQSAKGVRLGIAPIHKLRIFAYDFLAILLVHITLMFFLLAYMILILGVDFGTKIPALMVAIAVSSLLGVAISVFIAALVAKGEVASDSIFNVVAISSCFLAGTRGFVDASLPILKYINPATLMAESYYSLYVFDTYNRFGAIILMMLSMAFVCIIGTCFIIRRKSYASI